MVVKNVCFKATHTNLYIPLERYICLYEKTNNFIQLICIFVYRCFVRLSVGILVIPSTNKKKAFIENKY